MTKRRKALEFQRRYDGEPGPRLREAGDSQGGSGLRREFEAASRAISLLAAEADAHYVPGPRPRGTDAARIAASARRARWSIAAEAAAVAVVAGIGAELAGRVAELVDSAVAVLLLLA